MTHNKIDYHQAAADLALPCDAYIDGQYQPACSGDRFATISPIDGRILTQVASCDAADVDLAVASARRAFEDGRWRDMPPRQKKAVLHKLADLIETHSTELALLETLDMGKPISQSLSVDMAASSNTIRYYAEAVDKIYDEVAPTAHAALAMIRREPLGVVAAVIPWNFPLLMAAWKIGPALAMGNSVIVKPAEQSPLTALRLGELATQAGLPDGVLNILPGMGESAGQALGRHGDVDMIAFTGSTQVGKLFMRYAGESNMKRVSLECGGKSPHIIMPDCPDFDAAAKAAAFGIFNNQGQACNAGSRLLVQNDIREDFMQRVRQWAQKLIPGDPLDPQTRLGAMVDETQTLRVLDYIRIGQEAGARLTVGGQRILAETGGSYLAPTIFEDVQPEMQIAQEEIFGPVLATISFETLEEAIAIGNQTIYGLYAAIWTRDIETALEASRRLKSGVVCVNSYDGGDITTPFGGFKQSGFGRDKSLHALEKYADLKTVWIQTRS